MSSAGAFDLLNPRLDLIREYESSITEGLRIGQPVDVPLGWSGVLVTTNANMVDVLKPGSHVIHPANLPLLGNHVKLGTEPGAPVGACLLLVNCSLQDLAWNDGIVVTRGRRHGMTEGSVSGTFQFRVIDPASFMRLRMREALDVAKEAGDALLEVYPQFGRCGKKAPGIARAALPDIAGWLIQANISGILSAIFEASTLSPEEVNRHRSDIQSATEESLKHGLEQSGSMLVSFQLDEIRRVVHCPCVSCGSEAAPTAYATFRRNISLFYLRFTSDLSGNFCVPCAWKTGVANNLIMLVAGWWGIIGLVLTPFFLIGNTYHLISVSCGRKRATRDPIRAEPNGWGIDP
jgi:hypothetical protein